MATNSQWQSQVQAANKRIVRNSAELSAAVDAWANAAHQKALDALISAIGNAYGRLLRNTPVATGRAQGGWHIEGEANEWKPDKNGTFTKDANALLSRELRKASNLREADIIHIMNNVEYIMELEAGHSKQSRAFTALFLEELKAELTAACNAVSKA